MREFQSAGVLMTAVNGNYTFANTASPDLHSLSDTEMRSPLSTDTHFSLLTQASSTLSIVSQTQHCDYWPEFQESYNSIMDNTNLLDSCAAALNDISSEEGMHTTAASQRTEKVRGQFNRSLSSTTTNSSSSGNGSENRVTSKCVERFTRWLCEMENRVAAQPKLSKIVAMQTKQMAMQLEVHSKIFKEIVAQPCIVKGSKRNDYKSIEERYHLLYLKVYEVLLLLEGLPANSFSPSNRILSESFHDYESSLSMSPNGQQNSGDHSDGDNEFLDDVLCDNGDAELKTPIYTETSVLSTSIGTYYFNYDDTIEQQTDSTIDEKLNSNIFEYSCDKEFTFENDLHTLFNATDSICLKSPDQNVVSEHQTLQHRLNDDTVIVPQKSARIWNKIDFSQLAIQPPVDNYLAQDIDLAHHKVYDWLHSKTDCWKSKSTVSLDCSMASEADYQLVYRAKSEMDLPAIRSIESSNCNSPVRTSLNCLSLAVSPIKHIDMALSETVTEDSSLLWDNFQIGDPKADNDFGVIGSDLETRELVNKICFFGDDYSEHISLQPNESSTTESEKEFDTGLEQSFDGRIDLNVNESSTPSQAKPLKTKRSRRTRKKRTRKSSIATTSSEYNSAMSLDLSSEAGQSEATTASANSKLLSSAQIKNTATKSHDEFKPEKTISYNSNEKQFELHSKESVEPKKMRINEMRPEDFFGIVQMCHSNIDCVITVLGADPNRVLTVDYCQQMKCERYQKANSEACKCKHQNADASDLVKSSSSKCSSRTKDTSCNCADVVPSESASTCICAWVSHTIAMILNFLIDCWNVFRNMKLYTYLARFTRALFGSTRYVADHLKSKSQALNAKAIKYA